MTLLVVVILTPFIGALVTNLLSTGIQSRENRRAEREIARIYREAGVSPSTSPSPCQPPTRKKSEDVRRTTVQPVVQNNSENKQEEKPIKAIPPKKPNTPKQKKATVEATIEDAASEMFSNQLEWEESISQAIQEEQSSESFSYAMEMADEMFSVMEDIESCLA